MNATFPRAVRMMLCCAVLSAGAMPAVAQSVAPAIVVTGAWVRGTVAAQTASGAYMNIVSKESARLLGASSTAAAHVELHEMRMDGDTMKMRAVDKLELPAGKSVTLAPGGYHLMMLDLKRPLRAGTKVPLTLEIESAGGKRKKVEVEAEVRELGAAKHSPPL